VSTYLILHTTYVLTKHLLLRSTSRDMRHVDIYNTEFWDRMFMQTH